MTTPDIERACEHALNRLAHDLSPKLYFHSLAHTRDDVVPAAMRLAAQCGVEGEDLQLLRTAACYHDIGFIEQRDGHEDASARIAAAILPSFGYRRKQIAQIAGIIMATKLPQSPSNLLEQIMADADLDSLGREDFFIRNQALRDELAAFGFVTSDEDWYSKQLVFLQSHHYWTPAAIALRGPAKQLHVARLTELIALCQA